MDHSLWSPQYGPYNMFHMGHMIWESKICINVLYQVKIWFQNRRMKWKRSKKMKEDGKSEASLNNSNSSEDIPRDEAPNEVSSESEDVKIENSN